MDAIFRRAVTLDRASLCDTVAEDVFARIERVLPFNRRGRLNKSTQLGR
jgi:hypothetical protein